MSFVNKPLQLLRCLCRYFSLVLFNVERSCFQRLFHECCLDEIKKISTHTYNESNVLTLVNKIQDLIQLLVRHKNKVNCSF